MVEDGNDKDNDNDNNNDNDNDKDNDKKKDEEDDKKEMMGMMDVLSPLVAHRVKRLNTERDRVMERYQ